MRGNYKRFAATYNFDGERWCFVFIAKDKAEAHERLKRMCFATLDDELIAQIQAKNSTAAPVRWLLRLWSWIAKRSN